MVVLVDQVAAVVRDLFQEQDLIIVDQDVLEQVIHPLLLLHKELQAEQDL